MRRLDHIAPFDRESEGGTTADRVVDTAGDLTDEFWGRSPGWHDRTSSTRRVAQLPDRGDDTTGALRVIRDGVTAFRPRRVDTVRDPSGQVRRTRSHGTTAHGATAHGTAAQSTSEISPVRSLDLSIGDLAAGTVVARAAPVGETPGRDIPLSPVAPMPGRLAFGAIDPLLARLGALVVVGALLVPLALALRPARDDSDTVRLESPAEIAPESASGAGSTGGPTAATSAASSAAGTAGAGVGSTDAVSPAPANASEAATAVDTNAAPAPTQTPDTSTNGAATGSDSAPLASTAAIEDATQTSSSGIEAAATVAAEAERVVPECPQTYAAAAGDSWYRIADEADVTPTALLSENRATLDAVIFPGDEICLPAGATMPTQPTTTTSTPTTAPSAPTTTNVPAAPPSPASVEEVKQMIRDTWPADQHETALRIAGRESNFDPLADNNFCCFGIFQIYWTVHKGWLDDHGIYSSNDLLDAEKNIAAAYALYVRSGGWGPWGG
jgi:LysM repeat protein